MNIHEYPEFSPESYSSLTRKSVRIGELDVIFFSKKGVLGHGDVDIASYLLAERVALKNKESALNLNCGVGLAGLTLAERAKEASIVMADSNIAAINALNESIVANQLSNVKVYISSGVSHITMMPPFNVITVRLPKSKLLTLQLIWDAYSNLSAGGKVYIAGGNKEGIRSALNHAGSLFGNLEILHYEKGYRIAMAVKNEKTTTVPEVFSNPYLDHSVYNKFSVNTGSLSYMIHSRPGVFCWDRVDKGTELLISKMTIKPGETVLDLGCGNGIIGCFAAGMTTPQGTVFLVDNDICAVEASRRTIVSNHLTNCHVLQSDCTAAVKDISFDVVVTNPPFHQAKETAYEVARQFIYDAACILKPLGRLYLVANRFLPYESWVKHAFGNIVLEYQDSRYKILSTKRK